MLAQRKDESSAWAICKAQLGETEQQPQTPSDTDAHTCPPGEHWSEISGKCISDQPIIAASEQDHECPEGFKWNEEKQQCVDLARAHYAE